MLDIFENYITKTFYIFLEISFQKNQAKLNILQRITYYKHPAHNTASIHYQSPYVLVQYSRPNITILTIPSPVITPVISHLP